MVYDGVQHSRLCGAVVLLHGELEVSGARAVVLKQV